jgi:hypothetical protein
LHSGIISAFPPANQLNQLISSSLGDITTQDPLNLRISDYVIQPIGTQEQGIPFLHGQTLILPVRSLVFAVPTKARVYLNRESPS